MIPKMEPGWRENEDRRYRLNSLLRPRFLARLLCSSPTSLCHACLQLYLWVSLIALNVYPGIAIPLVKRKWKKRLPFHSGSPYFHFFYSVSWSYPCVYHPTWVIISSQIGVPSVSCAVTCGIFLSYHIYPHENTITKAVNLFHGHC